MVTGCSSTPSPRGSSPSAISPGELREQLRAGLDQQRRRLRPERADVDLVAAARPLVDRRQVVAIAVRVAGHEGLGERRRGRDRRPSSMNGSSGTPMKPSGPIRSPWTSSGYVSRPARASACSAVMHRPFVWTRSSRISNASDPRSMAALSSARREVAALRSAIGSPRSGRTGIITIRDANAQRLVGGWLRLVLEAGEPRRRVVFLGESLPARGGRSTGWQRRRRRARASFPDAGTARAHPRRSRWCRCRRACPGGTGSGPPSDSSTVRRAGPG